MGTRGLLAFHVNGNTVGTYNHYDSYPGALGEDIVKFLRSGNLTLAKEQASNLRAVKESDPFTKEERDICESKGLVDTSVGGGKATWYNLLRNAQGDVGRLLDSGFIIDNTDFAKDSLFCEWGYVVNFDDNLFEVYRGFQEQPHQDGRFASEENLRGYYPIKLIATFPMDAIPEKWDEGLEGGNE